MLTDPTAITVYLQHAGLFGVSSIAVPEDYVFGQSGDVAVLKLAQIVEGIAPSPINTVQDPPAGKSGTIIGFGLSDGARDDSGIKRQRGKKTPAYPKRCRLYQAGWSEWPHSLNSGVKFRSWTVIEKIC